MDDGRRISLKDKIKHYFCFSCCFPANHHHRQTLASESTSSGSDGSTKRPLFLIGSSSRWIKSRASSVDLPEIKHKIFGGIGGGNGGQQNHHRYHRRRRSSADFRYDPMSYALNFEEDSVEDDADPLKDFSARLPVSPPPPRPRSVNAAPSLKTRDHQEGSSQAIAAV